MKHALVFIAVLLLLVGVAVLALLPLRESIVVSDDGRLALVWGRPVSANIQSQTIDHPIFDAEYTVLMDRPVAIEAIRSADTVYRLDDYLHAWRLAESVFAERYAIGDSFDIATPVYANLREALLQKAPTGTIGYTLYQTVAYPGDDHEFLVNSLEKGGCDGIFDFAANQERSAVGANARLFVNDVRTLMRFEYRAIWEVEEGTGACDLSREADDVLN